MFDLVGVLLGVIMGAPLGASMDVYSVSIPVFLWVFLWEQHFSLGLFQRFTGAFSEINQVHRPQNKKRTKENALKQKPDCG